MTQAHAPPADKLPRTCAFQTETARGRGRQRASSAATQTAAAAIVVEGRLRQKDETTNSESETSETEGRRGVGPASVRVIRSARRACRADSRTTLKILEQERVFSTSTCTVRHSWGRGPISADQMMMTMMLKGLWNILDIDVPGGTGLWKELSLAALG
ncbi:unnamed protein product, partial [Ascophyllum nodosum]